MKKVYITSLHMMHGGVEMAITLLANALVEQGYAVEVLCIYNLGNPVYHLDERVKITYLTNVHPNKEEFKDAVHRKRLIRILKEGFYSVKVLFLKQKVMVQKFKEIDDGVIISTRNEHSVLLSKYGKANVKKIAQLHHDHRFSKKLIKDFQNNYSRIDYFVLLTESLKKEIDEMMQKNSHTRRVVIPNFLESIPVKGYLDVKNQVIAVGRLDEVKGFERMINLWGKLQIENKPVLKIIGNGDEKDNLQKLIQVNHLEDEVKLMGAVEHDKVIREMEQSILYMMTSYTEALPFVLLEAISVGLPVLAYDVRVGPKAIIDDGMNGYLIPDNDERKYLQCLENLLKDERLRGQMSAAAIKKAQTFSKESVLKKWISILEE